MTSFDHMSHFRQRYRGYSQILKHQGNLIYAWDANKLVLHNPTAQTIRTFGYKVEQQESQSPKDFVTHLHLRDLGKPSSQID